MAGGIAHEINNPLSIVYALTEDIEELHEENELNDEILVEKLKKIQKTIKRMSGIVRGLRNFARDGSKDPKEVVSVKNNSRRIFRSLPR